MFRQCQFFTDLETQLRVKISVKNISFVCYDACLGSLVRR